MKIFFHLTIIVRYQFGIAIADKFGNIRQKSFLKHHHDNKEKTGENAQSYQNILSERFLKQDEATTKMIDDDELHSFFGKNRKKLFLRHHHPIQSLSPVSCFKDASKNFDRLTWALLEYKILEAQFTKNHERSMYNKYFTTYLSNLRKHENV